MNINQKFLDFSVDVSARRCKRFWLTFSLAIIDLSSSD
jgi:hypothetical protein